MEGNMHDIAKSLMGAEQRRLVLRKREKGLSAFQEVGSSPLSGFFSS
jgi:hypothetical protein